MHNAGKSWEHLSSTLSYNICFEVIYLRFRGCIRYVLLPRLHNRISKRAILSSATLTLI